MNYKQLEQVLMFSELYEEDGTGRPFKVVRNNNEFAVCLIDGSVDRIVAIVQENYLKIYEDDLLKQQVQAIINFSNQSLADKLLSK